MKATGVQNTVLVKTMTPGVMVDDAAGVVTGMGMLLHCAQTDYSQLFGWEL